MQIMMKHEYTQKMNDKRFKDGKNYEKTRPLQFNNHIYSKSQSLQSPSKKSSNQEQFDNSVYLLAGSGQKGCRDGQSDTTTFNCPLAMIMLPDSCGTFAVSDSKNNTLRFISPVSEDIRHGNRVTSLKTSSFLDPRGLCYSVNENSIFVCDAGHHRIKTAQIPQQSILTGKIPSMEASKVLNFAGNGKKGWSDGSATNASFNTPSGLCIYQDGSFIVADTGNHCIRRIYRNNDDILLVTTITGGCSSSSVHGSGFKSTKSAGFIDGLASQALFRSPMSVICGNHGELIVADTFNNAIRVIIPSAEQSLSNRLNAGELFVTTIAGQPKTGHQDGKCKEALFNQPTGICLGKDGSIFVADRGNHCIRQIGGCKAMFTLRIEDTSSYGWVRTIVTDSPAPNRRFISGFEPNFSSPKGICCLQTYHQWYNQETNENKTVLGVCDTGNNLIRVVSIEMDKEESLPIYNSNKSVKTNSPSHNSPRRKYISSHLNTESKQNSHLLQKHIGFESSTLKHSPRFGRQATSPSKSINMERDLFVEKLIIENTKLKQENETYKELLVQSLEKIDLLSDLLPDYTPQ